MFNEYYRRNKERLLTDSSINEDNRKLWRKFFEFEELKLKRKNNLSCLDESCYKTLCEYPSHFRTVNLWFKNKSWKKLTRKDIEQVYNDLEDGKILNSRGKAFRGRQTYYNKIFKSKPFEMAKKKDMAKEVISYFRNDRGEVRFIEIEDFRKTVEVAVKVQHKLLLWLAFDIGENIFSLLQLQKKDFSRQINEDTKEPEYIINLPKSKIKRSRTSRSEITNFKETVQMLDIVLNQKKEVVINNKKEYVNLSEEDHIFNFQYRQGVKMFDRTVQITGIKIKPTGEKPTFKDLRSSMACHLLKIGWATDEVNARLGHKPSSRELDKYVSFLALNKNKPKKKVYDNDVQKLTEELEEMKIREKAKDSQIENLRKEFLEALKNIQVEINKSNIEILKNKLKNKKVKKILYS